MGVGQYDGKLMLGLHAKIGQGNDAGAWTVTPALEEFVRLGGRFLGQPAAVNAPVPIVDTLIGPVYPGKRKA